MKMTIQKKLLGGFFAVLFILAGIAGIAYYQISIVDRTYSDLIDDKARKLTLIKNLEIAAKDEQTSMRGYLIIGDEKALANYNKATDEYQRIREELEVLIKLPQAKKLFNDLNEIEKEYADFTKVTFALKDANKTEEYTKLVVEQGRMIVEKFSIKAEELSDYQEAILNDGSRSTTEKVSSVKTLILIISIISFLVGTLIAFYIGRIISKPIIAISKAAGKIASGDLTQEKVQVKNKDEIGVLADSFNTMASNLRELIQQVSANAEHVAATAEELSASSEQSSKATEQITFAIQEVASGVEKQFTSIEGSSQTINEMAAGVHQIASNSQIVSATALEASEKATEGSQSIKAAVTQMDSINQTVTGLSDVIQELGKRSNEISTIIEVITGISAQTNLLALNAAIEAARAGEHGRGFSVVADEVRKLAEQSAVSAQQISNLITGIQEDTSTAIQSMAAATTEVVAGIDVINHAGDSFVQIEGAVTKVNSQIHEVSSAAQQMAAGTEQMVQSMNHITEIGEKTSSSSQEVSAATEEQLATMEEITSSAISLSKMAEDLQDLIGKFKV
jgi:methyl-accepting chemotaxis protein